MLGRSCAAANCRAAAAAVRRSRAIISSGFRTPANRRALSRSIRRTSAPRIDGCAIVLASGRSWEPCCARGVVAAGGWANVRPPMAARQSAAAMAMPVVNSLRWSMVVTLIRYLTELHHVSTGAGSRKSPNSPSVTRPDSRPSHPRQPPGGPKYGGWGKFAAARERRLSAARSRGDSRAAEPTAQHGQIERCRRLAEPRDPVQSAGRGRGRRELQVTQLSRRSDAPPKRRTASGARGRRRNRIPGLARSLRNPRRRRWHATTYPAPEPIEHPFVTLHCRHRRGIDLPKASEATGMARHL